MPKTISVIIPVYKVEAYLSRCLNSILSQEYTSLEIILSDDGSPDGSAGICDEYALTDERIVVIHKQNGGVCSARNAGLKIMTGDYVTFADSDDYVLPGIYARQVELLEKENADIAICGFSQEDSFGNFNTYFPDPAEYTFSRNEQLKNLFQNKFYRCSIWDKLFRRETIGNALFDEKITHYEDLLFLYQVMKGSDKAVFTGEPFYRYCDNDGSAARSKFGKRNMTMADVWEYIVSDTKKNYPELYPQARTEFVRNNLMFASLAVKAGYDDAGDLKRIRDNVRRYVLAYMFSYAALGYKRQALLLTLSWGAFRTAAK